MAPFLDSLIRARSGEGRGFVLGLVERQIEHLFRPLNKVRKDVGLASRKDYFSVQRHASDLNIGLWPESFSSPAKDWPENSIRTGFTDIEAEADWQIDAQLREVLSEKPLVFAMGSEMIQDFEANARLFNQVCLDLNKRGVMVSPKIRGQGRVQWGQALTVLEAAPFKQLFPEASVVISHGGIGTLAKAFKAGRPSVVLPMAHDQFDNAFQVQRLKSGLTSPRRGLKARILTSLVERALNDDQIRESSNSLAQKSARERGAKTAAELIYQVMEPSGKNGLVRA